MAAQTRFDTIHVSPITRPVIEHASKKAVIVSIGNYAATTVVRSEAIKSSG